MGKHLVCIDQSLLHAVKHIGTGYSRNKLSSIGISKTMARSAIKAVVRGKLGLLRSGYVIELPAYGEIGMQVHGGSKLFDLERREVTKIFNPGTNEADTAQEIAAARQVSEVPDAPRFVDADPGMAWYREEYICGTHATDEEFRHGKALLEFYPAVEKCLLDLVGTEAVREVETGLHFGRLAGNAFGGRWLAAGLEEGHVKEISAYLDGLHRWLTSQARSAHLQLVPVHGDFSLVNAIATPDGLRFIDWEGISPGCVYDDIFNFLFVERYYKRATGNFMKDISAFLDRYGKAVRKRFPELAEATEVDVTFVRRQYYLERLNLLLDREVSSNLCKVVRKSIEMFREFDREAGDGEVQESP
jgi:hypothetical protein